MNTIWLKTATVIYCLSLRTSAATLYVAATGAHNPPFDSWDDAANDIQTAVTAAAAGDTVLIADGVYLPASEIALNKAITVRGASGNREAVIVNGNGATRCFNITAAATLADVTVTNGYASGTGGGIRMTSGTVSNCVIIGNVGTGDPGPGGVYMNGATCLLADSLLVTNVASAMDGGAVTMYSGAVRDCDFVGNVAVRWGGAVRMDGGALWNCNFTSNSAPISGSGVGGAINMRVGDPTVSNCFFFANQCSLGSGAVTAASGRLADSLFVNNSSKSDSSGGGVGISGANTLVERCVFIGNLALGNDGGGGAIGSGTLRNSLFIGNQSNRWGGALRADGGTIENCTVVGNKSGTNGGGIHNRGATILNTIIYNNYSATSANYHHSGGTLTNCCVTPLPPQGAGHITNSPLFILDGTGYGTNHIAGDYQLRLRSPCVNAGLNRDWMDDARDLAGNWRRFNNSNVDIGAYEFTLSLGTRFLLY